jgi:hypothetical protein
MRLCLLGGGAHAIFGCFYLTREGFQAPHSAFIASTMAVQGIFPLLSNFIVLPLMAAIVRQSMENLVRGKEGEVQPVPTKDKRETRNKTETKKQEKPEKLQLGEVRRNLNKKAPKVIVKKPLNYHSKTLTPHLMSKEMINSIQELQRIDVTATSSFQRIHPIVKLNSTLALKLLMVSPEVRYATMGVLPFFTKVHPNYRKSSVYRGHIFNNILQTYSATILTSSFLKTGTSASIQTITIKEKVKQFTATSTQTENPILVSNKNGTNTRQHNISAQTDVLEPQAVIPTEVILPEQTIIVLEETMEVQTVEEDEIRLPVIEEQEEAEQTVEGEEEGVTEEDEFADACRMLGKNQDLVEYTAQEDQDEELEKVMPIELAFDVERIVNLDTKELLYWTIQIASFTRKNNDKMETLDTPHMIVICGTGDDFDIYTGKRVLQIIAQQFGQNSVKYNLYVWDQAMERNFLSALKIEDLFNVIDLQEEENNQKVAYKKVVSKMLREADVKEDAITGQQDQELTMTSGFWPSWTSKHLSGVGYKRLTYAIQDVYYLLLLSPANYRNDVNLLPRRKVQSAREDISDWLNHPVHIKAAAYHIVQTKWRAWTPGKPLARDHLHKYSRPHSECFIKEEEAQVNQEQPKVSTNSSRKESIKTIQDNSFEPVLVTLEDQPTLEKIRSFLKLKNKSKKLKDYESFNLFGIDWTIKLKDNCYYLSPETKNHCVNYCIQMLNSLDKSIQHEFKDQWTLREVLDLSLLAKVNGCDLRIIPNKYDNLYHAEISLSNIIMPKRSKNENFDDTVKGIKEEDEVIYANRLLCFHHGELKVRRFNFTPTQAEILMKNQMITSSEVLTSYKTMTQHANGHIFERFCSDNMEAASWNCLLTELKLLKDSAVVVDVGSKFHKVRKLWKSFHAPKLPFKLTWISVRPNNSPSDKLYYDTHSPTNWSEDHFNHIHFEGTLEELNLEELEMIYPNRYIMYHDSYYYFKKLGRIGWNTYLSGIYFDPTIRDTTSLVSEIGRVNFEVKQSGDTFTKLETSLDNFISTILKEPKVPTLHDISIIYSPGGQGEYRHSLMLIDWTKVALIKNIEIDSKTSFFSCRFNNVLHLKEVKTFVHNNKLQLVVPRDCPTFWTSPYLALMQKGLINPTLSRYFLSNQKDEDFKIEEENIWDQLDEIFVNGVYKVCKPTEATPESFVGNHSLVSQTMTWSNEDLSNLINAEKGRTLMNTRTDTPRSGHLIMVQGQELNEYEYSAGWSNMYEGIFKRQLHTQLQPNPYVLNEFSAYTREFLDKLTDKMVSTATPLPTMEAWLSTRAWSGNKKDKYRANINAVFNINQPLDVSSISNFFTSFIKSDERYPIVGIPTVEYLGKDSKRGRLISNPVGLVFQGIGTYMQHSIHIDIKKHLENYCHGKSFDKLADCISRAIKGKNLNSLCLDGSNHDGHQHIELIKLVDFVFYDMLKSKGYFAKINKCTDQRLLSRIYRVLDGCFKTEQFKVKHRAQIRDQNGRKRFISLMTQKWRGTVLSGHPTLTTLGNTLRVLMYVAFYLKIPIDQLFLPLENQDKPYLVSGDDVVLWTPEAKEDREKIMRLSSISKNMAYIGLGQCYEEVTIGEKYDIDFLSKDIMYDPKLEKFYVFRSLPKSLWGSRYYNVLSGLDWNKKQSLSLHRHCVTLSLQYELPPQWAKHIGYMKHDISDLNEEHIQRTLNNHRFHATKGEIQQPSDKVVYDFYLRKYKINKSLTVLIHKEWHKPYNVAIDLPPILCQNLGIPIMQEFVMGRKIIMPKNSQKTKIKQGKKQKTKVMVQAIKSTRTKRTSNLNRKVSVIPTNTLNAERQMNLARLHPGTFAAKYYDHESGLAYPSAIVGGNGTMSPLFGNSPYFVWYMSLSRAWVGYSMLANVSPSLSGTTHDFSDYTTGMTTNDLFGGDMSELSQSPRGGGLWAVHMNFSFGTCAANKGSVVHVGSAPYGTRLTTSQLINSANVKTTTDKDWSLIDYVSRSGTQTGSASSTDTVALLSREQVVYFVIEYPTQTIGSQPNSPLISWRWKGNITWMPDYTNTFTQGVGESGTKDSVQSVVDLSAVGLHSNSNIPGASHISEILSNGGFKKERMIHADSYNSFRHPPIKDMIPQAPPMISGTGGNSSAIQEAVYGSILDRVTALGSYGHVGRAPPVGQLQRMVANETNYADHVIILRFVDKLLDWWGPIPNLDLEDLYACLVESQKKLSNYNSFMSIRKMIHKEDKVLQLYKWSVMNDFKFDTITPEDLVVIRSQGEEIGLKLMTTQSVSELIEDLKQIEYKINMGLINCTRESNALSQKKAQASNQCVYERTLKRNEDLPYTSHELDGDSEFSHLSSIHRK